MKPGGRTGEHLEMVAAKAANYTLVVVSVVEIDTWVARIECDCSVYFQHYHLMLPQCHLGIVVSQTAHLLETYWLSSAEIHLLTWYISEKQFRRGRKAPSEWTRLVRAVRDAPVADYSAPGINIPRRVAHRPLIAVSPFLP